MARVYLETSFVSACVTDRGDTASVYRRQVSTGWWKEQRVKHQLFVAQEVLAELSHPDFRHRSDATALIDGIALLPLDDDVRGLARILVREKVMPGPLAGDAIHVAVATVQRMEYVLTWNVRHLANANKLEHLRIICSRVGYVPPQIVTPDILWDYEE
jgi:hypothetical protein